MILDITVDNFQQALIQASMDKTVMIFFHADQVPECQPMRVLAERLIGADNRQVDLARVDVADPQLQSLAMQLGLQALPALVVFKGGQPVDMLEGPQDETTLRAFFQPYLPSEAEQLLDQAKQLLGVDPQAAYGLLQQARALDDTPAIRLTLAETALALNKLEETRQLLDTIGMADQDSQYQHVLARLKLAQEAADSPALRELEQQLAITPEDLGLKEELAVQYFQAGRQEEALQLLTEILQKDLSFGEARKRLLDMLTSMGVDPLASRYRRKLYSMLY